MDHETGHDLTCFVVSRLMTPYIYLQTKTFDTFEDRKRDQLLVKVRDQFHAVFSLLPKFKLAPLVAPAVPQPPSPGAAVKQKEELTDSCSGKRGS